jgi:predicted transcriptional regulator
LYRRVTYWGEFIKKITVEVFGDAEKELIATLASVGVSTNQAKILLHLKNQPESNSKGIELSTDMRQPEVSMATKDLITAGWVKSEQRQRAGKGRPQIVYSLNVPFNEILGQVEAKIKSESESQLQNLSKLKALVSEAKATV